MRYFPLFNESRCFYGFGDHDDSSCQSCVYQLFDVSVHHRASDGGSAYPFVLCNHIQLADGVIFKPLPMGLPALVPVFLCIGNSSVLLYSSNLCVPAYGRFQLGNDTSSGFK